MNIIVFTGPTLQPTDAPGITFQPPAERGSVYLAAQQRPDAIGVIDGFFDQRIAVWHKEILWALEQGIPVYGAASMGALRAAELSAYGMTGIGSIFEKFHSGEWMDDDEVAVAHATQEHAYRPSSEAMANIRFTLAQAQSEGVITPAEHSCYIDTAKAMFYPERSYKAILAVHPNPALHRWHTANRIDQKRADALALIAAIRKAQPHTPDFALEPTVFWDAMHKQFERSLLTDTDRHLLQNLGPHIRTAALAWWLLRKSNVTAEELLGASEDFCTRHGITEIEPWLAANRCTIADLDAMLASAARAATARQAAAGTLDAVTLHYLRWSGEYPLKS